MRIDTMRMRITIGVLGILLPWIVTLLIGYIPPSISATYYTNASTVFMIILGWASGLLICYMGYEPIDDIILTLTGIAGLGICLFPCSITSAINFVGTFKLNNHVSDKIHIVCAIVFFLLLSYNSLFLFTKGAAVKTRKKKARNVIFIICGVGMIASFALLLIPIYCRVWLAETVALTLFGISFLTKANRFKWLFCDGE
jgi:hypothetical protein